MAKMVGLARPVKIEWLNRTVELLLDGKSVDEIKADLNEYLSFEIDSPTSLRKTRESLINTWIVDSQESADVRAAALEAYKTGKASKLALHWCMLSLSYPIFADIATLIGKISHIQDEFTTAWVKEKLYESWGERTTLDVPVKNILRTLVDFGTLCKVKTGVYGLCQIGLSTVGRAKDAHIQSLVNEIQRGQRFCNAAGQVLALGRIHAIGKFLWAATEMRDAQTT